jgi:hypothetical protein
MFLSFFLITLITAGGFALTYVTHDDEPLMYRLAAGCVIGSAVFGTLGLLLASAAGLTVMTAGIMTALMLVPLMLLYGRSDRSRRFATDWNNAKNRLQGKSIRRLLPFVYYLFFFLVFLFFFERTMFVRDGGIFTGGSNNLGDLPFHLGAIFSFTEGANFPPANPNFAGAKFTYPFIADLVTAYFVKLGAGVKDAMLVQNVAWTFAILVILQRFVVRLLNDKLAARIAPFLLFFSGGLGFIWFFSDYFAQSKPFLEFLNALPKDYTIGPDFRWGNSLNTLFITQRSLLLGLPITLVIITSLWQHFSKGEAEDPASRQAVTGISAYLPFIGLGLLAGMLVLIHLHSLIVLFIVCVFLLGFRPYRQLVRPWAAFAICVAVIALPELLWSISGSATEASEFISRHFGWDSGEMNIVWFWIKNTGIFIPLAAAGAFLVWKLGGKDARVAEETPAPSKASKRSKRSPVVPKDEITAPRSKSLLLFLVPFVFIFVIANLFKFAPWQWDNIKLLIYWWVGSIPFVAYSIAYVWRRGTGFQFAAAAIIAIITLSGAIDVYRVITGQINYGVFDKDAVEIGEAIRTRTPVDALFLNAPTYNTAVVLSGRGSLLRYPGHLSSHGINYGERIADTKTIYSGGPAADSLLQKHGVDYVLLGPEVQNFARESGFAVNDAYFTKFELLTATAKYKIYKIK